MDVPRERELVWLQGGAADAELRRAAARGAGAVAHHVCGRARRRTREGGGRGSGCGRGAAAAAGDPRLTGGGDASPAPAAAPLHDGGAARVSGGSAPACTVAVYIPRAELERARTQPR